MRAEPVTPQDLARSVWAVPPLALDYRGVISDDANRRLVTHIESGGVSTILWGGNANLPHLPMAAFADLLARIPDWCADDTWAIPSVGPDAGRLAEQAATLRDSAFPAVLALPYPGPCDPAGVETALRRFAEDSGKPLILYLRRAGYLHLGQMAAMIEDGTAVGIKYAVEPPDPARDPYLDDLLAEVPAKYIVSGIGEIAAINHMSLFGLPGFTAGAVCIDPARAMAILAALQSGDEAQARRLATPIEPLEALRQTHGPIPVIHAAVSAAGIADMGRIGGMFSALDDTLAVELDHAIDSLKERTTA